MTAFELEGAAFARAVAEAMGWVVLPGGYNGKLSIAVETSAGELRMFDPLANHNHAAEVRAEACRQWGGRWNVDTSANVSDVAYFPLSIDKNGYKFNGADECIVVCRVFLAACEALGKGEG